MAEFVGVAAMLASFAMCWWEHFLCVVGKLELGKASWHFNVDFGALDLFVAFR